MLTSLLHNALCSNAPGLSQLRLLNPWHLFKIDTWAPALPLYYVYLTALNYYIQLLCRPAPAHAVFVHLCLSVPSVIANTYKYLHIWNHSCAYVPSICNSKFE